MDAPDARPVSPIANLVVSDAGMTLTVSRWTEEGADGLTVEIVEGLHRLDKVQTVRLRIVVAAEGVQSVISVHWVDELTCQ